MNNKRMKVSKLLAQAISIIMVAILLLVCIYGALNVVQSEVAVTSVSTVNSKDLSQNEVDNIIEEVTYLQSAKSENINVNRTSAKRVVSESRSIILSNFNDMNNYVYIEFQLGGYAIYDRISSEIFERTENGAGPYCNYNANDSLYYGGPMNYYVKVSSGYKNIVDNVIVSKEYGKVLTSNCQEVSLEIIEEQRVEQMLMKSNAQAANSAPIYHYLGENIADSNMCSSAMWYFTVLDILTMQNSLNSRGGRNTLPSADFGNGIGTDVVFAKNGKGSCSIVALAMVLQYYERSGFMNFVPDDVNNFNLMYDYKVYTEYGEQQFSSIDKNLVKAESLHQELLWIMFPEERNKIDPNFAIHLKDMQGALGTYLSYHGLDSVSATHRNNASGIESQIKKGNPVMVSFQGEYNNGSIGTVSSHSVVAYAYTSEKVSIWENTLEYVINMGWYGYPQHTINNVDYPSTTYGTVYINENLPYANMSLDVF